MIGDSISLGMESQVFSLLDDVLESYHNPGNADNSNVGAHSISAWLTDDPTIWSVISFQFGLHDLAIDQERLTISDYTTLLTEITRTIKKLAPQAKLLFPTTTPVPTNLTDPSSTMVAPPRYDTDVQAFNKAAVAVMKDEGVPVLDLYTFVHQHCTKPGEKNYESCDWQLPRNVHYEPMGWTALAGEMASAVRKLL